MSACNASDNLGRQAGFEPAFPHIWHRTPPVAIKDGLMSRRTEPLYYRQHVWILAERLELSLTYF